MAGIDPTGFVVKTYTEILDEMRAEYVLREGSGRVPDWARNKVQGIVTVVLALAISEVWGAVQQVYESFRPSSATGEQLDNLCELVGVERQGATFSTVSLSLTGTAGVFVPAGQVVEDVAGFRWATLQDVTLPGTTIARATTLGAVTAPATTVNKIVSAVTGWSGVSNPAAASPGLDRETDLQLRESRLRRLQRGTTATMGGVQSALEDLDFVTTALVVDNDGSTPLVVGPYTIPPKAFLPVIAPETLTADQIREAAQAILDTKPIGIQSFGPGVISLPGPSGVPKAIGYALASAVAIDITVTVTIAPRFGAQEVADQVLLGIRTYLSTLTVGSSVRLLQLLRVVGQVAGAQSATVVLGRSGDPLVAADLTLTVTEYPIEGTFTVL